MSRLWFNPSFKNEAEKVNSEMLNDFSEEFNKRLHDKGVAPHDTGNLRRSLDWESHPTKLENRHFTACGYGAYQELGTVKMSGKYYFRRGFQIALASFENQRRKR